MPKNNKHIYFVPGLSASSKIFEYLDLPADKYTCHYLEWITPENERESIEDYALRLCAFIKESNPILVGVSFGGIMVQEMARIVEAKKTIIISSVKNELEFPEKFKFAKITKIYKLFPTYSFKQIGGFAKEYFGPKVKKKIELYEKYQYILEPIYLKWAFYTILHWKKTYKSQNLYHIHGDADKIFPPKYITDFIPIKNGTHLMIIIKAKEISKVLQEII